jgi:hypothetical protein
MIAESGGETYSAYDTLEAARTAIDVSLVIEGDDGGTIYLTVPVSRVCCSEARIQQLAEDIDALYWNDRSMLHISFEVLPVGSGVAGGMGGGRVIDGIWLHPKIEALGITADVEAVLGGTRDRIAQRSR